MRVPGYPTIAVDSVGWISQRKNTLSLVFYLASILSFLKFDDETLTNI